MSWLSSWWNNEPARDAAQRAQEATQANNTAALTADQTAAKNTLDMQKVMAYLQTLQGNQTNAQQLALSLSGQQQQQDQFAQLYNQDQTNNLPLRQAQLAGLSAMTPLMQMAGMQGYNPNTTLDTTKLVAPNVANQFNQLSNMYQQQGEQNINPQVLLQALSDPGAFLASQTASNGGNGGLGTGGAAAMGTGVVGSGQPFGTSNGPNSPSGNLVMTPQGQANSAAQQQALKEYYAANPQAVGVPDYIKNMAGTLSGPNSVSQAANAIESGNLLSTPLPVSATSAQPQQTTSLTPYVGQAQGSQVTQTPGYAYKLAEAQRQMQNQLSAQGLSGSGAGTMMMGNMGQQIAGDEYTNQYNRLMDMVKLGMGMQPTTAGTQAGNSLANIGQSGQQNISAALQNAAQGRSSLYNNAAYAYGQNQSGNASSLASYYGANSAASNAYANSQANQQSGFGKLLNTGMQLYGMGAFGGGGVNPNTPAT